MVARATRTIHTFNLWVVFKKAEDVRGQWIAHCLDLDLVTQGRTLPHALEMIEEATWITLFDDIAGGRDPLLRRAPKEYWKELWDILKNGKISDLERITTLAKRSKGPFVAHVVLGVHVTSLRDPRKPPVPEVPFAAAPLAVAGA